MRHGGLEGNVVSSARSCTQQAAVALRYGGHSRKTESMGPKNEAVPEKKKNEAVPVAKQRKSKASGNTCMARMAQECEARMAQECMAGQHAKLS